MIYIYNVCVCMYVEHMIVYLSLFLCLDSERKKNPGMINISF